MILEFNLNLSVLIILNDTKQIPLDRGKLNSDLVLAWGNTLAHARDDK